jgi:hypothetical protein
MVLTVASIGLDILKIYVLMAEISFLMAEEIPSAQTQALNPEVS